MKFGVETKNLDFSFITSTSVIIHKIKYIGLKNISVLLLVTNYK
jgi:hypothetical protein